MSPSSCRIPLSPPHFGVEERVSLLEALESGWLALGPEVGAFEEDFARKVGVTYALAVSSGTAAMHLALIEAGVGPGDSVFVSSLTFVASANPILYLGGIPVFIGSERNSWNMDPGLLEEALKASASVGRLPQAVVVVHVYGQSAHLNPIRDLCQAYGVPMIEDAAEALGATYLLDGSKPIQPGTLGQSGVFSFNGNKIITTAGGGMLVSSDATRIAHARKLSTQAREPVSHYEHTELGYNYRLPNLLAAIGRVQLERVNDRVSARQRVFERYRSGLSDLPGLQLQPEADWGKHSRWLTCLTIQAEDFGVDREGLRVALEEADIEARPLWKPLHLQAVFRGCSVFGGGVDEALFRDGLCVPSGSSLSDADQDRVIEMIRRAHRS